MVEMLADERPPADSAEEPIYRLDLHPANIVFPKE